MIRYLLLALLLAILPNEVLAQGQNPTGPARAKSCTVATLNAGACGLTEGTLAVVTDASAADTCSSGGGSTRVLCLRGTSSWTVVGAGAAGAGTPQCTAAQLAAESCGGTTAETLAIVTNGARDAIQADTCETSTPTPTRAYVCRRDAGTSSWKPLRAASGSLTIAASNASAHEIASADIRCASAPCQTEMQAAINVLQARLGTSGFDGGGELVLSGGRFELDAPPLILCGDSAGACRRVTIRGAGPLVTQIFHSTSVSGADMIRFQGNATNRDVLWYTFRDFGMHGRNTFGAGNDSADCLDMLGDQADNEEAWDVHVYNVYLETCGGAGYRGYAWGLVIQDSVIEFNGIGVLITHGQDAKLLNNKFSDNAINVYLENDTENGAWGTAPTQARMTANLIRNADPSKLPAGLSADSIRLTGNSHIISGNVIAQTQYTGSRSLLRFDDGTTSSVISNNVFANTQTMTGAQVDISDAGSGFNLVGPNQHNAGASVPEVVSAALQNVIVKKRGTDGFLDLHADSTSGLRILNNDGDSAAAFGTILRAPPTTVMGANAVFALPGASATDGQGITFDASLSRLRPYAISRPAVNYTKDPACAGLFLRTASDGSNECEATPDGTLTGNATIAQFSAESVPANTPATHYRLDNPADTNNSGLRVGNTGSQPTTLETQPATVGCWVYSDDDTPSFQYWLQHAAVAAAGYRSYIDAANNQLYTEWGATTAAEQSASTATAAAWHHMVMAYDTTDSTAKVYIDGALACNGNCGTGLNASRASDTGVWFGGTGTTGTNELDGRAYECFFMNRALTQHEVCAIARCGFADDIADRALSCDMGGIVCAEPGTVQGSLTTQGWYEAASCAGTTGTLSWDTRATAAPAPVCAAGATETTQMRGTADFDAAADEEVQREIMLPADWDAASAIVLALRWRAGATTNEARWCAQVACVADGQLDDAAWDTVDCVEDTAAGTTNQVNTATLTLSGAETDTCAASELLHLRVYRDADNAGDDMTGDASLVGAMISVVRDIP